MSYKKQKNGYLPDETPTFGRLMLYAIQQVIVMFPATIAVALITGFQVSTTIFASGLSTLCFILITKRRIPLYYGSSFSYLVAIANMANAEATADQLALWHATNILPADLISKAQFGIIMSGFVSIIAGLIVNKFGPEKIEKFLPASIIAMIVSCFTPLIQVIYGIPSAVIGGIELYCFGAIAAQGIAILIDKGVSMFDTNNIAVIALVSIVGIGGQFQYGGEIPFFGLNIPCVAGAAIFGIVLNFLLTLGDKIK